jgi:mevalonate kinase
MTTSSNLPDSAPGHRPAVATACGKVILLGEHAVVYGEPALAVPLSGHRLSVVLAEQGTGWAPMDLAAAQISSQMGLSIDDADPSLGGGGATQSMPSVRGKQVRPIEITLDEQAPPGASADIYRALGSAAQALGLQLPLPLRVAVRGGGLRSGMGTSAALGTALGRALLSWYGYEPEPDRVFLAAAAVENMFHGEPSGIDHTVSTYEKPVWFEKGMQPTSLTQLPSLMLVVRPGASSERTRDIVEGVRLRVASDPSLVRTLAEIGRWSRIGRSAWSAGQLAGLAQAMTEQQVCLEQLGVVHEQDHQAIAIARSAGALAAKITGAGWGGTVLALVEEHSAAQVQGAWGAGAFALALGS